MKFEGVRGMRDILPEEARVWQAVEAKIREVFALYGYKEIRPPVVERAELFARGVGEATEVVHKEMYVFPDRKGLELALRPEATASVLRAYIEHGLHAQGGVAKLYYLGPMFRYEKPQMGRQRQFHQYGVEALGSLDPALDAEVMALAWHLMESFDLEREALLLRVNSIGCREDRPRYRKALRNYFVPHAAELCADCQRRLEENPLRILDCKEPTCRELARAAPRSTEYLCPLCQEHFAQVLSFLDELGLAHEEDPTLVRGLDYYTRTVFELASKALGAQDALLGGGRYDELVEVLGGPPTPGVGFAGGMERLILVLSERRPLVPNRPELDVYVVPIGAEAKRPAVQLLARLRRAGLSADMDYMGRSVRKMMEVAGKRARFALILGPDELARGEVTVKDLQTGASHPLPLSEAAAALKPLVGR